MVDTIQTLNDLLAKARPCPFCGGLNLDVHRIHHQPYIFCLVCNAVAPCGKDIDEALQLWNTRPNEDAVIRLNTILMAKNIKITRALHTIAYYPVVPDQLFSNAMHQVQATAQDALGVNTTIQQDEP